MVNKITEDINYIGVFDRDIDLFESQYVVPDGISYNSYIIFDEKTVIMDTVDKRASKEWLENVSTQFKNRKDPDYLIVSHLEPDHSANIMEAVRKFPNMKIVLSTKAASMISQFFKEDLSNKLIPVKEGDGLDLGKHKLKFYMAPMVHWPEVMFTYDETEKILFSADAFGKFGNTSDTGEKWLPEARRYFINICGKYGMQVQAVLKKASGLDIKIICPLHGTILKENLEYYINKYDIWSSYQPEDKESVLVVYNSIHGNTRKAVFNLIDKIKNEKVKVFDLSRNDMSEAIGYAFAFEKMIIASPTYDAGLFPTTEKFLRILKHKNYQNKKIGIIENGSWAPMAGKLMKELFSEMNNIEIVEPLVTIKTTMNDETEKQFNQLIDSMKL